MQEGLQYLKGAYRRGDGSKLKEGRFTFFTMRVVKHWHRLSREAVDTPSLKVFKARLDGALSSLV